MNVNEKTKYLEDTIHSVMMTARICVEDGDATKEEMSEFLTEISNKEFNEIFSVPEKVFMMMALRDLLHDMSNPEVRAMFMEGDDCGEEV